VGQRHFHGSLYVYLDQGEIEPLIVLKEIFEVESEPREARPYLIESRWRIFNLREMSFDTTGFGLGEMVWSVPQEGTYAVAFQGRELHIKSKNGTLHIELPQIATDTMVHVEIRPL
jgi:hypothetical protein